MPIKTFLLSAATSLLVSTTTTTLAQNVTTTTTLTLPLYGLDPTQSLAASVIAASPNATTLYINCLESPSDPLACVGFAYSRTLITGPETYRLEVSEADLTSTQDCSSGKEMGMAKTGVVCEEYMTSGEAVNYQGVATYPLDGVTAFEVAVTAGVGKLMEAEETGGATATPSSSSSSSPGVTATMTGDAPSGSMTGAAAARGVGKEMALLAVVCGMGSLWL
ncbi:uncharacterized protein RCC_06068 [Ramularia collo-cygni]|uniref:AA1-like domain-containing protein n=1 Tax=Ramularia collo-cygni TaxID=112498 RepID=A0A2D3UUF6_9PEZI|nr:uncharacterized protein RCC_06068 [Ramularia collo-cygni]CZT20211.1 uncharacterized protein RCC_06068 [Ramularia collo-cygni]